MQPHAQSPSEHSNTRNKAGCLAFARAFLRLFRKKKRRKRSSRGGQLSCEKPAAEECPECGFNTSPHPPSGEEVPEALVIEQACLQEPVEAEKELEGPAKSDKELVGPAKELEEPEKVLEEVKEEPVLAEPDLLESDHQDVEDESDSGEMPSSGPQQPTRPGRSRRKKKEEKKVKDGKGMVTAPRSASPELLLRPRGALLTFRSDVVDPPATLLMGTDKEENDHLLAQATESVVFFHVDGLPSAHVYLQLEPGQGLRDVPRPLVHDAAQLCKANSSQGNKLANVVVVYTPGSNLRKTRHMKTGQVGFASDREVCRVVVAQRDEKVMERLNSTKRKVTSAKAEREKQQRARQRQLQKVEEKRKRRQRRERQEETQGEAPDLEDASSLAWGAESQQPASTRATGKQRRKRRKKAQEGEVSEKDEQEQQTLPQGKTTRCFPVLAEQRRLLQGCRATVEQRFDVQVTPPRKGDAEACGTVTGAPEDVADALQELRRLLQPARQKDGTGGKGGKGKGGKAKAGRRG